jgi:hypothetical protein
VDVMSPVFSFKQIITNFFIKAFKDKEYFAETGVDVRILGVQKKEAKRKRGKKRWGKLMF